MSSDDEFDDATVQAPMPSPAWVRAHRDRLIAEDEARERDGVASFAERMLKMAADEEAAWKALACGGELERVSECSDEFQSSCPRRDWEICPRHVVARKAQAEREKRARMRVEHLGRGIPERVLCIVYDRVPEETDAITRLRAAEAQPSASLFVLSGGVGCGKSVAAGEWAMRNGARFVTAVGLSKLSPYESGLDEVQTSRALVIDDLGAEYMDPKGFFASNLDALINHRYANKLRTVITTNVARKEFRPRYGDRIADRIREAGAFLEVEGQSLRRRR